MSRRWRPRSREGRGPASLLAAALVLFCSCGTLTDDETPGTGTPQPLEAATDFSLRSELSGNSEVAREASRVVSDPRYQTEWPAGSQTIVIPAAGGFAALLMWVLIGAGAIVFVVWLVSLIVSAPAREAALPVDDPVARESVDGGPDLTHVERLARERRYDEAVHAMLLISIRQLGRRLPVRPSASTTSRELLRALPLSPGGRRAFGELVRQVELSLFGGQPLDAEQYALCRTSFGTVLAESRS